MTTLSLGVVDIPYTSSSTPAQRRAQRWMQQRPPWESGSSNETTGDVATILERRYGIMATFFEMHGAEIAHDLERAMEDKLEALLSGAPAADDPQLFSEGMLSTLEQRFRAFLDNKEMDGIVAGVPTKASLMGVSRRRRNPRAGGGARPSFIDSGQFQASFRAWVDT